MIKIQLKFLLTIKDIYYIILEADRRAGVLELADEADSKSVGSDTVRVRPPPPAPNKSLFCPSDKRGFY